MQKYDGHFLSEMICHWDRILYLWPFQHSQTAGVNQTTD